MDFPQARQVRELGLEGIYFLEESKRYYPMRNLAAQVLGYAGIDDQGLAGLELTYDEVVTGTPGRRPFLRDARSGAAAFPQPDLTEARPGRDLYLTLDATIQHIAERELARAVDFYRARRGTVVMLDPWTGAVLAMASYPSFDPNAFERFPPSRRRNPAVQDAYEPGSTFKMVTASAALAANVVDPTDVIDCEMGRVRLPSGITIKDHKPFGLLSFREVIARSSNVGAIKTGLRVGQRRLYEAIEAFGFGATTGIDLPGESRGLLRPLGEIREADVAYLSFGQSLSLTPLQLAVAFGAVANGGTLLRPYVVAGTGVEGRFEPLPDRPQVQGHPLSPATAREIERLLEAVVEEGGGKAAAVPGYRVAGKTGTAQKAVPGGGYSDSKHVASFVGFAPARNPAVVAVVVIDEPVGQIYGGVVAAPVFSAIVGPTLLYLGVPPEGWERRPPRPLLANEAGPWSGPVAGG
jgi:cell division protein FtsI (penicillin-binding protein 3)